MVKSGSWESWLELLSAVSEFRNSFVYLKLSFKFIKRFKKSIQRERLEGQVGIKQKKNTFKKVCFICN